MQNVVSILLCDFYSMKPKIQTKNCKYIDMFFIYCKKSWYYTFHTTCNCY